MIHKLNCPFSTVDMVELNSKGRGPAIELTERMLAKTAIKVTLREVVIKGGKAYAYIRMSAPKKEFVKFYLLTSFNMFTKDWDAEQRVDEFKRFIEILMT